jgi:hypothetical protein
MTNKINTLLLFLIFTLLGYNTYLNYKYRYAGVTAVSSPARNINDTGVPAIKSMPDIPPTTIQFDKIKHDFGIIKDDKKVYTTFAFTNTGKEPVLIFSAEASCGCTVPEWPKEPIAPGATGKIEVAFDPNGKSGEQSKTVVVKANTEPSTSVLIISATIIKSN